MTPRVLSSISGVSKMNKLILLLRIQGTFLTKDFLFKNDDFLSHLFVKVKSRCYLFTAPNSCHLAPKKFVNPGRPMPVSCDKSAEKCFETSCTTNLVTI